MINFYPTAPTVTVGNASGKPHQSIGTAYLGLPNLPTNFPRSSKFIPLFKYTLIGHGLMCNAGCKVFFAKGKVIIYDPKISPILTG